MHKNGHKVKFFIQLFSCIHCNEYSFEFMTIFIYSFTLLIFFLGTEWKYIRKFEIRVFTVVLITTWFLKLGIDYAYATLPLLFLLIVRNDQNICIFHIYLENTLLQKRCHFLHCSARLIISVFDFGFHTIKLFCVQKYVQETFKPNINSEFN